MFMKLTLETRSYRGMYTIGNHFKVANVEDYLTTNDSGVVAIFEQECTSRQNDENPIFARLKYIGWVEEILELNYGVLKMVVLFCNWVKANYTRSNALVKRNEYMFKLVNFTFLIPISKYQPFDFPLHVDQKKILVTLRKKVGK